MLTIPDLNRLRSFYFVYTERSLVRAASRLSITRSAVSQSLKYLEKELKLPLFVRSSKSVVPTKAANRLYEIIDPFFRELTASLKNLESEKREVSGLIRIGAPVELGSGKLIRLMADFQRLYPLVTFELSLAIPEKQLSMLVDQKLDVAFVDNADVYEKSYPVSLKYVLEEHFVLIGSKEYCGKHVRNDPTLDTLKSQRFVDYVKHGPVLRMWFKHHFRKNVLNFNVVLSVENVNAVITAVEEGMGLGVVPEYLVENRLKSGDFLKISSSRSELVNKIGMATSFDKRLNAAEKAFVQFCQNHLK